MTRDLLRLRQVAPDAPDSFIVLSADDTTIGRIVKDKHLPAGTPAWGWSLGAFQYRHRPDYAGRSETLDEAKATLKERWPDYVAELEYDGVLERLRREKLGVPTRMFVYEDEFQAAPAQIEALAGCLEGTVEEARLSLLAEALARFDDMPRPLRQRVAADLAARARSSAGRVQSGLAGDPCRRPRLGR